MLEGYVPRFTGSTGFSPAGTRRSTSPAAAPANWNPAMASTRPTGPIAAADAAVSAAPTAEAPILRLPAVVLTWPSRSGGDSRCRSISVAANTGPSLTPAATNAAVAHGRDGATASAASDAPNAASPTIMTVS